MKKKVIKPTQQHEFTFDDDVPLPVKKVNPLMLMQVGQSFETDMSEREVKNLISNANSRKFGRFVYRKTAKGYRVWREA